MLARHISACNRCFMVTIQTRNLQQETNILNLDKPIKRDDKDEKYLLNRNPDNRSGRNKQKSIKWSAGSIGLLAVPAIAFSLGCWQVYRLQWKVDLIERLKSKMSAEEIDFPINELSLLSQLEYSRVRIRGEFLHDREFVIQPRGRFDPDFSQRGGSLLSGNDQTSHGGHVITPFKLYGTNLIIMVNRGWVPRHKIPREFRINDEPKGIVSLVAIVRKSEKRPQFVGRNDPEKGLWFYKDFQEMAVHSGSSPIYVEAVYESTLPNGPIGGQTNATIRNEHLSYIITWFMMSLVTFAMWISRFRR